MSAETVVADSNSKAVPGATKAGNSPEPGSPSRIKGILIAALVVLALAGALTWLHYRNQVSTDDAQVDAHLFPVASRISGSVAEVLVNDNQAVKAGDALVKLDPRDFETRVEQARAASAATHGNSPEAAIAKANLDAAQLQLSFATIVAPANGVVTRRSVEKGQVVQAGQGLLVIVPLDNVFVTANFKETQLAGVHPGQRAEVTVDTYGKTFRGHVDSISGASGAMLSLLPPENATGNFVKVVQRIPVKIVLDEAPSESAPLRPGMGVDAIIFLN